MLALFPLSGLDALLDRRRRPAGDSRPSEIRRPSAGSDRTPPGPRSPRRAGAPRPARRDERSDPGHRRHTSWNLSNHIIRRTPATRQVLDHLVDERHKRGVEREIIPLVVQVGGEDDRASRREIAVDKRRFPGRKLRQRWTFGRANRRDLLELHQAERRSTAKRVEHGVAHVGRRKCPDRRASTRPQAGQSRPSDRQALPERPLLRSPRRPRSGRRHPS